MSFENSTGRPLDENEINFETNSNDTESGMSPDDFVDHEISSEQKLSEEPTIELSLDHAPVPISEANHSVEPPPEIITQFGAGEWKQTFGEGEKESNSTFDFAKGEMLDTQGVSLTEKICASGTPEQIAMHDEIITKWKNGEAAYITYFETVGEDTIINVTKTWVEPNGVVASATWSRVYEKKPIELAPPQAAEGDDEGGADDGIIVMKVETVGASASIPSESLAKKENVSFFVEPTVLGVVTEEPKNVTKTETQIVSAVTPADQTKNVSSLKTEIATADTTGSSHTFGGAEFVPTPTSLPTQEIKTVPVVTSPKIATEKSPITIIEAPTALEVSEPTEIKKEPLEIVEITRQEIPTAPLENTVEKNISNPPIVERKNVAGQTENTVVEKNAIEIETTQENLPESSITENSITEQKIVSKQQEKPLVAEHIITFENPPKILTEPVLPVAVAETAIDNIAHSKTENSVIVTPKKHEAPKNEAAPLTLPENSGITLEIIDEQPENETETAKVETHFQPNIIWSPEKNAVAVPEETKPLEKSGIEIEIIDEPAEIVENTVEPVHTVTETLKREEPDQSATKIITPEITGIVLDEKIEPKVETVITPSLIIAPEIIITTELNREYQITEVPPQTDIPIKIHEAIAATASEKSAAIISEQKIPDLEKPKAQEITIDKPHLQKTIVKPIAAATTTPRPNIWRAPRPRAESTAVRKNKSAAHAETLAVATSAAPNFIRQERPRTVARVLNVLRPVELVRALTRRPAQIPDPIEDPRPLAHSPLTHYAANS